MPKMHMPSCVPCFPPSRGWQHSENVFWRKAEQWFCHGRDFDLLPRHVPLYIAWWPWRTHQAPEATSKAGLTHCLPVTMIFYTGPTKPALVLLCCVGAWLAICSSSFGAPISKTNIQRTLELLKEESKALYEDYNKTEASGISPDESLQLPCFSLGREALTNISGLKAYLEEVKSLSKNTVDTTKLTKRLVDISCLNPLNVNISRPQKTDSYTKKTFILSVLKKFSDCMAEVQAKDNIC
uniref:Interleukin 31 n=1 Tax=Rattus norvegicus TaxID=10116 RepID=A0A8I6AK60_RAT